MSWEYAGDVGELNYYHHTQFENGYGASVVCHEHSYGGSDGLFELAVTHSDNKLCYATEVTSDVLGYRTHGEIAEALAFIEALPANELCGHKARRTFDE